MCVFIHITPCHDPHVQTVSFTPLHWSWLYYVLCFRYRVNFMYDIPYSTSCMQNMTYEFQHRRMQTKSEWQRKRSKSRIIRDMHEHMEDEDDNSDVIMKKRVSSRLDPWNRTSHIRLLCWRRKTSVNNSTGTDQMYNKRPNIRGNVGTPVSVVSGLDGVPLALIVCTEDTLKLNGTLSWVLKHGTFNMTSFCAVDLLCLFHHPW